MPRPCPDHALLPEMVVLDTRPVEFTDPTEPAQHDGPAGVVSLPRPPQARPETLVAALRQQAGHPTWPHATVASQEVGLRMLWILAHWLLAPQRRSPRLQRVLRVATAYQAPHPQSAPGRTTQHPHGP